MKVKNLITTLVATVFLGIATSPTFAVSPTTATFAVSPSGLSQPQEPGMLCRVCPRCCSREPNIAESE